MAKPSECHRCTRDFGIFRWRYECPNCHKTFCADCLASIDPFVKDYALGWDGYPCDDCNNDFVAPAIEKAESIRSFSANYLGRIPFDQAGKAAKLSSGWCRQRADALYALKVRAAFCGFDLIYGIEYEQDTASEPSNNGRGQHRYTVWCAEGVACIEKKRTGNGEQRSRERRGSRVSRN